MIVESYKTFPQERLRQYVIKLQKLLKNKNKYNKKSYERRYKDIMNKLYPILQYIQYMQINKKVVHLGKNRKKANYQRQEGYSDYQDDLVYHQIEQMINYIPKVDTNRKRVSDIFFMIQIHSSRVYFYSTILDSPTVKVYYLDTSMENSDWLKNNNEDNDIDKKEKYFDGYLERLDRIQNQIYIDYYNNKISNLKFLKYDFIIHLLYFFIIEDKKSNVFNSVINKNIYVKDRVKRETLLIWYIYQTYKKKYLPKENIILIGQKTISDLIKNYFRNQNLTKK